MTTNYNSTGPLNTLLAGPPVWTATYPNLAATPGNPQVTAYGPNQNFCGLQRPWTNAAGSLVARVNCFDNLGNPINTGFFASYSSRL